jgi:hypothetical protein
MNFRKSLLAISIITIFSHEAVAQVKHQIALNGSQFIKQFITPNNAAIQSNNPYIINYRCMLPKLNLKVGIGGTYSFLNEDFGSSQFTRNTDNQLYNARLGIDKYKTIYKKWGIYYGIDYTIIRGKTVTKTVSGGPFGSNTIVTRTNRSMGASGCFTIEYKLNEKISFFSEMNLNFARTRTAEKVENPDFPNSNSESKTRGGTFIPNMPMSIFFAIIL